MSQPPKISCARTNAVLAVHLDGDFDEAPAMDREQLGYEFLSSAALHDHLSECTACQQVLQRARRLDAVLASTAGQAIADQVTASGRSFEELTARWLDHLALHAGTDESGQAPGMTANAGASGSKQ